MRDYLYLIRENGQHHRTVLGLEIDDLSNLEYYHFDEFMKKHNGQLCSPLLTIYNEMEKILKQPMSPKRMVKFSYSIIDSVGINKFIREILAIEPNPPIRKDILECFAKGLACTCCIDCKLYT
jgi:hypothetical protein